MRAIVFIALVTFLFAGPFAVSSAAQPGEPHASPPPARRIPGINAEDRFPGGCVSCHVQLPERDARLSTAMKRWAEAVEPKLLAKVQAAAPEGVTLKGKHPPVMKSLENIPEACMACHKPTAKTAPPFARMLHVIHLSGADDNHFMTLFQGECTYCHKLDLGTGIWSVPSGPEK
jgi:hypothetical protein